jgi:membrane protease YdiL (CAAX protease family)
MTEKSNSLIHRFPLPEFYILAFLSSWAGWIPQLLFNRGMLAFNSPLFSFLGGAGPTLAAVIVIWILKGRDGPRELFAPLTRWRTARGWYLFVFLAWFGVAAGALAVMTVFGDPLPVLANFAWGSLPLIFLTMLLSNVWEEIGWRGFALPRFQARYGDLALSIIMGLVWSLWHLPLMLDPASPMSGQPWYGEVLFSLSLTVIYTWLFNRTRGSLLFVSVFHAMSNTVAFVLLELGVFAPTYLPVVGITTLFALGIILVHGPRRFTRGESA